jgi:hypothetical protein
MASFFTSDTEKLYPMNSLILVVTVSEKLLKDIWKFLEIFLEHIYKLEIFQHKGLKNKGPVI